MQQKAFLKVYDILKVYVRSKQMEIVWSFVSDQEELLFFGLKTLRTKVCILVEESLFLDFFCDARSSALSFLLISRTSV